MRICQATQDDLNDWQELALQLWPNHTKEEMRAILTHILTSTREEGFLVRDETETAIAFMNLSLRYEYVPGATKSPVAYIEGIYVSDKYRKQGLATRLIHHAEQWAREQHCTEIASDALLDNTESHRFHQHVGFHEVERVVTFIKLLEQASNNPENH